MKINFEQVLVDLKGENIKDGRDGQGEILKLKTVCVNSLLSDFQDERSTGEEKVERYELAKKIHAGGEIDLKTEKIAMLKQRVGKLYLPIVVGQVYEMLEGKKK